MREINIHDEDNKCDLGFLFASPIYSGQVHNFNDIQSEIKSYLKKITFKNTPKDWGLTHLISDNTFEGNVIEDLKVLSTELEIHVKRYCRAIEYYSEYSSISSWFTLFKKGHYGQIHCHSGSDISGVYYYKTNGNDGDIFFESPVAASHMSNLYRPKRYSPKLVEGKLLLFPSWLHHGIMTNETNNDRISLSFNLKFSEQNKIIDKN